MVVARRMEAQRAQALHVLNTTLNSIDQGLLMTDAHGICTVFNQRALVLLDMPEAFLASRPTHRQVFDFQINRAGQVKRNTTTSFRIEGLGECFCGCLRESRKGKQRQQDE
jgi:sensor histidine kinase regulating citrate/malate metabolism